MICTLTYCVGLPLALPGHVPQPEKFSAATRPQVRTTASRMRFFCASRLEAVQQTGMLTPPAAVGHRGVLEWTMSGLTVGAGALPGAVGSARSQALSPVTIKSARAGPARGLGRR